MPAASRRTASGRGTRLGNEPHPPQPPLWKLAAFISVIVLAFCALLVRLIFVQIAGGPMYAEKARANQIRLIPIVAPRGRIYDRNGIVLVRNRPSFVCVLIPSEVRDVNSTLRTLSIIVNVPQPLLQRRLLHHNGAD